MPPPAPAVPAAVPTRVLDPRDVNLAHVMASADRHGVGELGKLIGVMTALDESDLYMYANAAHPLSLTLPHDRVGSDKNSLGLFQQRLQWWGTGTEDERVQQLMDPGKSADLFFEALQRVVGWEKMFPWQACQAVQRSGTPDGSNYHARLGQAQAAIAGAPDYFTRNPGG